MKKIFFPLLMLISASAFTQTNTPPCSAPEASQFDFWIGEWDLHWQDSLRGSNRVERVFGNCAVQENFLNPKTGYSGKSWSVYNSNYKLWQQTWIDSQGGYIHLTGRMTGDSLILYTEERTVPASVSPTGKMKNRMVYYNIKKDSFDWSWEASTDSGLSWKPSWQIHYARRK